MQTLLEEIHRITGATGDLVPERGLSVAYEKPLDFYLTECLALATTAVGRRQNQSELVELARAVEPEWTAQLLGGHALLPSDVSGARLGLFSCALGICPFDSKSGTLAMDSISYRITQLAEVFKWFNQYKAAMDTDGPAAGRYIDPGELSTEDPARGHLRAEMPVEFLVAMIHMLHHTGITRTLRQSLGELIPSWYIANNPATTVSRNTQRRASDRKKAELVYTVQLSDPSAASALMRAVVVVELARQHISPGSLEDTALPKLLDWDIHKFSQDAETHISNFGFSVLVAAKDVETADGVENKLNDFMAALYKHTGAFPVIVPRDAAAIDHRNRLVLLLEAFIGAQWPSLPQYATTRPTLWRQRRADPGNPEKWLTGGIAAPPEPATNDYLFETSGHIARQQMMQARIGHRLSVNRWCRECAAPLPPDAKALTCAMGRCQIIPLGFL